MLSPALVLFTSTVIIPPALSQAAQMQPAEVDLSRVDWQLNRLPNPGFEEWYTDSPHNPVDISTYRSTEKYTWYAHSPWPVANGTGSLGAQVRAVDPMHSSEQRIGLSSWTWWSNPVNMTMSFYYYIDQFLHPVDTDYFYLTIILGSAGARYLNYYFGCENTAYSNSTFYRYFNLPGTPGEWNLFG